MIINNGDIHSNGKKIFGHTPMTARPTADAAKVRAARICGCGMSMGIKLINFFKDEVGVTAIEYGLIAALIAVVIIVAITAVGLNLGTLFNTISANVGAAL